MKKGFFAAAVAMLSTSATLMAVGFSSWLFVGSASVSASVGGVYFLSDAIELCRETDPDGVATFSYGNYYYYNDVAYSYVDRQNDTDVTVTTRANEGCKRGLLRYYLNLFPEKLEFDAMKSENVASFILSCTLTRNVEDPKEPSFSFSRGMLDLKDYQKPIYDSAGGSFVRFDVVVEAAKKQGHYPYNLDIVFLQSALTTSKEVSGKFYSGAELLTNVSSFTLQIEAKEIA